MEILVNSLFIAKNPGTFKEKLAGGEIKHASYCYLFFENKKIGIYFSGKNWFKPITNFELIDLKGKITLDQDNYFESIINDPYSENKIILIGEVINRGNLLKVKGWWSNSPESLFINDEFEKVDVKKDFLS